MAITNPNWKNRLAHDRACRDAFVACGNRKPTMPDPPGGLVLVEGRIFNGEIFHKSIRDAGHTAAEFGACRCSRW